ncbi:TonB-dependent siderophore receptor [Massilia oculi]|uniref:TonB-dependent siderophore receptor n=1 Tax=Massilia oculi TaxID=945844 RepID=UPI0028B1CDCF|nr:TonB-dependent siderophore receptor [Massilia oculi]
MTSPMRLPLALALALAYPTHAVLAAEAPDEPVAPTTVLVTADKFENGYAVDAASVAKGSASLRETPQSVSVVNRQRLNDQNLRTLDEALANITGLVVEQGSSHERRFYSRGFEIDTIQYDGVATQRGSGFNISPDLSVFERVEVLRGPAGLFNGSGSPGGTVNLVRKRPLKTNQVEALASAGRWDNYRAQVDANRVLNDSGSVRARVVGAYEDREFFYDVSKSQRKVLYAIVEADLAPSTTVGVGLHREENDLTPFYGGLPRFADGGDLGLPRSTYMNAAWSDTAIASTTAIVDLNHRFNDDWKLRVAFSRMREDNHDLSGSAFGAVDRATNRGPSLSSFRAHLLGEQKAADATLEGSFRAFGRRHDVLLGANWMQRDYDSTSQLYTIANPVVNPYTFNPYDYAVAPTAIARPATHTLAAIEQSGIFGSLRFALTDSVKLIAGGRVSDWKSSTFNLVTNAYSTRPYKQDGEVTPYGALQWDFAPEWTTYLSYAEIFRSQANQYTASGDPLDPATGSNIEAGLKGALFGGRLNASLAAFQILEKNRSQSDPLNPSPCIGSPTGGGCFVAEGEVRSEGLDAELTGQVAPGLDLSAGYTWNQTKYLRDRTATGLPSANENQPLSTFTPRHLARIWASWRPAGSAWSVGGGVNAQSLTYKTSGALRLEQRGYAVWSGRVGYRINRNLLAALNFNNIFDKHYYRTLGSTSGSNWYGEPRNVTASLQATF